MWLLGFELRTFRGTGLLTAKPPLQLQQASLLRKVLSSLWLQIQSSHVSLCYALHSVLTTLHYVVYLLKWMHVTVCFLFFFLLFHGKFYIKMVDIKTPLKLIEGGIRNICDKIKDLH